LAIASIYLFSSEMDNSFFEIYSSLFVILSSALSFFIIIQGALKYNQYIKSETLACANFPNHNLASGFIIIGIVITISFLLFKKNNDYFNINNERFLIYRVANLFLSNKFYLAVLSFIMIIALVFAFSRGALMALLFSIVVITAYKVRNTYKVLRAVIIFFIVLLLAFLLLPESYSTKWLTHKFFTPHGSTRKIIWQTATRSFLDKPLTGWGPGNFEYAYHKFKMPNRFDNVRYGKYTRFAHNEYLQFAVEMGIPGIISFLWLALSILKLGYQKIKTVSSGDSNTLWRYATSLSIVIAILLHSLFEFNLHFPIILFCFSFFTGFLLSSQKDTIEEKWIKFLRPLTLCAIILCLSTLLSYLFSYRADRGLKLKNYNIAEKNYELAVTLNPLDINLWKKLYYSGAIEEAENTLKSAIFFHPMDSFLYQNLARTYLVKSRITDAFSQYKTALELNPANPFFYSELAETFYRKGWFDDSLAYFKKSYSVEPIFTFARVRAGQIYLSKGNKKEALKEFNVSLKSEKILMQNPYDNYTKNLVSYNYETIRKKINEISKK
ncbi:MAG: O-antigen ligase family protein, partial [Elusimicrobiota bacterium]